MDGGGDGVDISDKIKKNPTSGLGGDAITRSVKGS